MPERNCPFYGRSMHALKMSPLRILLLDSRGNQCGVITDRHAPCGMEIDGLPVDWQACPLLGSIRVEHS
jgi:hypothetical protein